MAQNSTIGTLAVNIVARTGKFNRKMKGVRGVSKLTAGVMAGVGVGAVAAGVGLVKLGQAYETLNRSMNRSLAIMGNVSDSMRTKMTQAAIDVSAVTSASASEAADAYFFLASAGLDAEQSLAALPRVAEFAQAGNFGLALATDLLTDAQSALGLTVKDTSKNMTNMTRVSDVLVKANTLANATVQQFSESLTNKAGAALRIVGKDMEEGVAVLAAFADQGVKGAEGGVALNIVMRDLQTKAIKFKTRFKEAGIAVFDTTGEMRNMADIVSDLEGKLIGLSDAQKKSTLLDLGFADKSVAFIQALVGTSEKIRAYETALRGAGGATSEVAGKQLTDLEKALNRLGAAWNRFAQSMGPAVSKLAEFASLIAEIAEGAALTDGLFGVNDIGPRRTEAGPKFAQFREFQTPEIVADRQVGEAVDFAKKVPGFLRAAANRFGAELSDFKVSKEAQEKMVGSVFDGIGDKINNGLNFLKVKGAEIQIASQKLQGKAEFFALNNGTKIDEPLPGLSALQAGTAEAFAASRKNLNPSAKTDDRIAKANEAALVEQKGMNESLQKIASNDIVMFGIT